MVLHKFAIAACTLALAAVTPANAAAPAMSQLTITAADLASHSAMRIVAFGSSSTQGVGASSAAATYPARLQSELIAMLSAGTRVTVANQGIGGEDAEDMARRLPALLAQRPDLIIWQTGTNDPLRGLPLARFVELTRAGIAAIRAAGIDVMLMEPQDCPVFAGTPGALSFRDAVRSLGAELGIPVVRRFDLMHAWLATNHVTLAQLQSADGLHMSDMGYALLAKAVAHSILSGLASHAGLVTGRSESEGGGS